MEWPTPPPCDPTVGWRLSSQPSTRAPSLQGGAKWSPTSGVVKVTDPPIVPSDLSDTVTDDGVFHAVRDGYDPVYDSLSHGETFNRIWRDTAYRGEFPAEFAPIGFLTFTEVQRLLALLQLRPG
jgi:hypothetical protein